ncbi:hypothetical protein DVH05_005226 [Phytophthora capsici]|nr:hypothetical protein DVH05_005226 [Phytophthora capsici]
MTIPPEAVPLAKDKKISSWIVQIEPQFKADWNSIGNDDLIALYVEKAKENGYDKDIRKLLDSDTNLYGADCGYSDPNATPKTPPSDGTATFSRGIAHHVRGLSPLCNLTYYLPQGPCEIWVGDKMALHDDDCAKTFGAEDYMIIINDSLNRYLNPSTTRRVRPVVVCFGSTGWLFRGVTMDTCSRFTVRSYILQL